MNTLRTLALACLLVFLLPVAVRAAIYWAGNDNSHWSRADWSSTGVLPQPQAHDAAMVRIYSSRVGRWRGIFATHSWIVVKDRGAKSYQRFDKVGWGLPIRVNGYAPDGRWFGNDIEPVFAADGIEAEKLIPRILAAVDAYAYKNRGDYSAWPGPNSNTFVASVLAAVPDERRLDRPRAVAHRRAGESGRLSGRHVCLGGGRGVQLHGPCCGVRHTQTRVENSRLRPHRRVTRTPQGC